MFVDPLISRKKTDRELAAFLQFADVFRRRGIWLLEYDFPKMLFAFAATNANPTMFVPFGVLLDFANYNVSPPSVRIVNPATKAPLRKSEVKAPFQRARPGLQPDELLQAWCTDDEKPFICLQGVREYHENAAHTGDSWFLHRNTGAGTLVYILDNLARYGSEPIRGQQMQLQIVPQGFLVVVTE